MDLNLIGKRALVCGGTRGIGRATAHELATLGAEVTVVARTVDALEQVRAALPTDHNQTHDSLAVDFSDEPALRTAIAQQLAQGSPYHILVNNTGGPPAGRVIDAEPEAFLTAIRLHLVSAQILLQALLPGMKSGGYGRVINIVSTSVREPIPNLGVSNTTRGAMASWAKTLSKELGPDGITVNNILPGYTDTARLDALLSGRAKREGVEKDVLVEKLKQSVPLGRFARPEETAAAVAFLASPAGGYVSGVSLPVDGGRLGCI